MWQAIQDEVKLKEPGYVYSYYYGLTKLEEAELVVVCHPRLRVVSMQGTTVSEGT